MTYYGYVLVCVARFACHFQTDRGAHSYSMWYIGICQMFSLIACFMIVDALHPVKLQWPYVPHTFVAGMIAWFIALSEYYSLSRVDALNRKFDEKTPKAQRVWKLITIASLIVPILIMFVIS